jgi:hypothetical protein
MANKKNQITIEFSDGDTLKDLQKKVKKAAGGFNALATSQRGADRAGKGLTRQSSNQTKNFSKMQQGISGGIVPIYATLAAQVFAVTAAFQFLSNSVDYKNLIAGQESFGAVTGTALKTYTLGVQAATEGQLRFSEAAQSVAIGTAAGLSRSQITEIGKAAKNTSLALGRDLTDSFNRLTRGITKAEPELLDELGIILRLDPALRAYADQIGKSKEQLNQFEKSQAIANEVLDQAESKFGKIAEIMDPSAFALQQFAVAFDDLLNKFKVGIGTVLLPLLGFLSNNVYALTAALGLFALPIVKTILPNFAAMGQAAKDNMELATKSVKSAQSEFDKLNFKDNKTTRDSSMGSINMMRDKKGQKKVGAMYNQMNAKQIASHKKMLAQKKGDYINYTRQERQIMFKHLKMQERSLAVSEGKKRGEYAKTTSFFKLQQARMVLIQKKASVMMVAATRMASGLMTKLLSFAGVLGVLAMIGAVVMGLINHFRKVDEEQEKLTDNIEEQIKLQKVLNTELERMNEVRSKGLVKGGLDTTLQFGNMVQSADMSNSLQKMKDFKFKQERILNKDGGNVNLFKSGSNTNADEIADKMRHISNVQAMIDQKSTRLAGAEEGSSQARNLTARIAEHQKLIDTRKEEIALLEENSFADEKLQETYENNLKTIKELEKGAVGPLKKTYADYYKVLKDNGNLSQEQIDDLRNQESAFNNLTERVKRYGEVSKSFQQSLTSMSGKGMPLQNQRKALNDMIITQEALISRTKMGGEVKNDPNTLNKDEADIARIKNEADAAHLVALQDFKTELDGIVSKEKEILTTQQTNARTFLDHANARTIAEKKAKIEVTGMLKVNEKLTRAKQDQANAEAVVTALKMKGNKTRASFEKEFGENAQFEIDKYIEGGGILEEQVQDAEYAVELAEDKVATVTKEVEVQKILNAEQQKQLDIAALNLQLKKDTLNENSKALAAQIGNVGFNTMYGGTGFGAQAKKEQDVEQKKFQIEEKRLALVNQRAVLAKQKYAADSDEQLAEEASINNNQKKLDLLKEQTRAAEFAATHLGQLQMSFAKGIEDMFVAIAQGSMSAKEAFKEMALMMLKQMAQIAAQQLALKALGFMGFPTPLANGGIIPMATGGIISKYSQGGIATEPTYLVGEGKHNEAVVPLPNGRSIPVDMKGGSGTNNVSINVNVDGSSSNVADGEKGKQLGKMMEVAVMEVIQREKRPGGVLGR